MTETPWHADPGFWAALEPHLFPPEKFADAPAELDGLLSLVGGDPGTVLDMPCGVGRHAVELAGRGFDVTAVDATERYLASAREHAASAGVTGVEFVHEDMRRFRRPAAFDLALNLYTSFGYFEDAADDERLARNVYESLRPGGRFVVDVASKELLARDFRERDWSERDGTYLLEERTVTDDWSWMESRWVLVDDGVREFTVSHRLYSARELTDLLAGVGFDSVEAFGDFEGSAFGPEADRLVVVARKE